MTIYEIFITYACSWWLVLFMVLPWKVKIPEKPGAGHAASAPANPMLGKKAIVTSILAWIPVGIFYILYNTAWADDSIYHAGRGKCHPVAAQAAADVKATDTDATIRNPNNFLGDMKNVKMGLNIPAGDFTTPKQDPNGTDAGGSSSSGSGSGSGSSGTNGNPATSNVDLRHSDLTLGSLNVNTQDGSLKYNGQDVTSQGTDCN